MKGNEVGETLAAARLAAIVEWSEDAIVSKSPDGTVTSWNPAAERLFGYSAEEMIGHPISVLAAPGREDEMPAILERLRRGEKVQHYQTVRRRKDGSLVDISLTVSPIRDQTGRVLGASKIARDITEQKRAEQAIRESEERFRTLANTVPALVWTANPEGTITFANDRWFRFCGVEPERNAREWPELVVHPEDRERYLDQWAHKLREGSEYEIETRNRRHDGEYRWFLTRAVPLRDAEGLITAWFGSMTDIHDRKQAEEQQQRMTAELSHRVKNILTVVQVLANRTADRAVTVAEYQQAFQGRLRALNSAHQALMARQWDGASLSTIVRSALEPYLGNGEQVRFEVQDVSLSPELALTLSLGLHELATNAAKYGALSRPSGRLALIAHIQTGERGDELRLTWQEDGGPPVQPPQAMGFGLTMLSRAIEYEHGGRVELDWRSRGLLCRVTAKARAAPTETLH